MCVLTDYLIVIISLLCVVGFIKTRRPFTTNYILGVIPLKNSP